MRASHENSNIKLQEFFNGSSHQSHSGKHFMGKRVQSQQKTTRRKASLSNASFPQQPTMSNL